MWFIFSIIGFIVLYVSGRKWGEVAYNYARRRLPYALHLRQQKIRPPTPTLSVVESDVDSAKNAKKYDLEMQSNQVCLVIVCRSLELNGFFFVIELKGRKCIFNYK